MEIKTIIAAAFAICAFFLVVRYNLHMFQLNGYKENEHRTWIKKNIRKQWVLYVGIVLGIIRLFFLSFMFDILVYAWLCVIILVYNALRKQVAKKQLVYTARVKRLIVTDVIICLLVLLLCGFLGSLRQLTGIFLLLASLQFVLPMIANIINRPIEKVINKYYIRDAKKKLSEVSGLTVIGVTGSYGKTSLKFYLQALLTEKYNVLVTPESYNTPMGVVKTIRSSLKPTDEIFICEMGARYVGDIKEICDIVRPKHGIITAIGPQHLETFHNLDNIKNTKFELAAELLPEGILFLNGDNSYIREKAEEYDNLKVFYYSGGEQEGYYAKDIAVSQIGTEFTVVSPNGSEARFQTRLVGEHNVINLVGAIAVANTLGIALKDLRTPVRQIRPVKHRLEMLERGAVTVIDDAYNSNPIGSKAAVETLAMFEGIRILVTPGMVELGEKEEEYNFLFGTYAAACCDYILLVGGAHTKPIAEGAKSHGFPDEKCKVFDNVESAVAFAYRITEPGHKYILLENDLPDNY